MNRLRFGLTVIMALSLLVGLAVSSFRSFAAPTSGDIVWDAPRNISNTPDNTSTDPFLLSDPTGKIYLFWAEKAGDLPGNNADTLMFTLWDGSNWFNPIDIFFAPDSDGNPIITYPHATLDEDGIIHLIWLQQPNFPNYTLFYSSSFGPDAMLSDSWSHPIALAADLSGTKYSIDIAYRSNNELHVVYARVQQGDAAKEERAVAYVRSLDGGRTWSDSVDISAIKGIQNGASDTRILVDDNQRLYATWTEWDATGLGQGIYFTRSLDNGASWEQPISISRTIGNEYERDWSNIEILGPDKLVVMWEGGWRAYRHAQYSDDGGETWSDPVDTFPWLIGENGTVEFARDSNNQLHLFIAQRVREGYFDRGDGDNAAVWHSVWEGGRRWSEPRIVTPAVNLINPKAVITGGNQVMLTWYTQRDLEIMVMNGRIQGVAASLQPAWLRQSRTTTTTDAIVTPDVTPKFISETTITPSIPAQNGSSAQAQGISPVVVVLVGILSALLLIGVAFLVVKRNR